MAGKSQKPPGTDGSKLSQKPQQPFGLCSRTALWWSRMFPFFWLRRKGCFLLTCVFCLAVTQLKTVSSNWCLSFCTAPGSILSFWHFQKWNLPSFKEGNRVTCKETGKISAIHKKQTVCCQETGITDLGIPFKPCISKLRYHLFWDDTHCIRLLQSRYRKIEDGTSWMILITCSHRYLDTNLWHSLDSRPVNHW